MQRRRSIQLVVLGVLGLIPLLGRPAAGDLYTSVQPSLEWLVDTSDVIFVATRGGGQPEEHLEPDGELLKAGDQSNREYKVRRHWPEDPERQLYFLRRGNEGWHVVRMINLDHPLAWSNTSAITAAGAVLEDADEILKAVAERVTEKRSFTGVAEIEEFEKLLTRGRPHYYPRDPAWVESQLGGFVWVHGIGIWDSATGEASEDVRETDMIVTGLIVPADEARRAVVFAELESLLANRKPDTTWHYWRNLGSYLWALANYRSDDAVELLDRYRTLAEKNELVGLNTIVSENIARICDSIEMYWRYQDSMADPANDAVAGRWEIGWVRKPGMPSYFVYYGYWIDLLLTRDHRFVAMQYRVDKPHSQPTLCRRSSGHWLAEGGELRLVETDTWQQEDGSWLPRHIVWIDAPLDRERMVATDSQKPEITIRRVSDLPAVLSD